MKGQPLQIAARIFTARIWYHGLYGYGPRPSGHRIEDHVAGNYA